MTTTNEKEEEWKRLRDMESEAERNKRIGEAQKEFSRVLNDNSVTIGSGNKDRDRDSKPPHFVQKYSKPDGSLIAEAVVVADIPFFAVARNKYHVTNITLDESIEVTNNKTEYKPFDIQAYLNKPYTFKSRKEFDDTIEKAKHETLDTLYKKVKKVWSKYIDADDFHLSICAADT